MQSNVKLLNRVIFVLSIAGLLMAVYVLQSWLRHTSIVCITGGGCDLVRKNPASYILGVPVPAVGLVGYAFLTILAFLRTANTDKRLLYGILGMAIFGICFVTWFTYTEIFIIKGICTWCAVSAVNMYVIFILSLLSLRILRSK